MTEKNGASELARMVTEDDLPNFDYLSKLRSLLICCNSNSYDNGNKKGARTNIHDGVNDNNKNNNSMIDGYVRNTKNSDNKRMIIEMEGCLALQRASKYGHLNVLQYLIENKIGDVNALDHHKFGSTPLAKACKRGDMTIVRYLVEIAKADIRKKTGSTVGNNDVNTTKGGKERGITAVIKASEFGHLNIVQYLVEKGGYLDSIEKSQSDNSSYCCDLGTSLLKASQRGHLNVVKYLVENCHVDIGHEDRHGRDSIRWAICTQNDEIVKYLFQQQKEKCRNNGTTTTMATKKDYDAFEPNTLYSYLELACMTGSLDIVKFLYQKYPEFNNPTGRKENDLLEAALVGNKNRNDSMDTVKFLLEKWNITDVNSLGAQFGRNFFQSMCILDTRKGKAAIRLLQLGASPTYPNQDGVAPLHLACGTGKLSLVRCLCEKGADANARAQSEDITPGDITPLHFAKNRQIARYLVEKRGANMDAWTRYGMIPLHYACLRGWLGTAKYLIETGIFDVDIPTRYNKYSAEPRSEFSFPFPAGCTPLHLVCALQRFQQQEQNQILLAKYLLEERGANPFARNSLGNTPFAHAWYCGSLGIAKLLIETVGPKILHSTTPRNAHTTNISSSSFSSSTAATTTTTKARTMPRNVTINQYKLLVSPLAKSHPIILHALSKAHLEELVRDNKIPDLFSRVTSPTTGNLPLHDACKYNTTLENEKEGGGGIDIIEYMIEKYPAGLFQKNSRGRLPLHEACGNSGIIAAATTTDKNDDGTRMTKPKSIRQRQYEKMRQQRYENVLSFLIQHHPLALVERDNAGRLPLEIAILNGDASPDAIYLLLKETPPYLVLEMFID